MNEGKRRMARDPTRRDGSETGCPVSFFFPKGALTHHLRNARHFGGGGIPPNGRAVRSARRMRRLRTPPDDAGKAPLVRAVVGAVMDSASRNCRDAAAHCTARPLLLQNLPPAGFANGLAVGSPSACFYGRRDGLPRLLRSLAMTNTRRKRNRRKEV